MVWVLPCCWEPSPAAFLHRTVSGEGHEAMVLVPWASELCLCLCGHNYSSACNRMSCVAVVGDEQPHGWREALALDVGNNGVRAV